MITQVPMNLLQKILTSIFLSGLVSLTLPGCNKPKTTIPKTPKNPTLSLYEASGDIDLDGDEDKVVAISYRRSVDIKYLENKGRGFYDHGVLRKIQRKSAHSKLIPGLGDYDEDGDLDIIIMPLDSDIIKIENHTVNKIPGPPIIEKTRELYEKRKRIGNYNPFSDN